MMRGNTNHAEWRGNLAFMSAALCVAHLFLTAPATGTILVSTTGNDLNDGLTWATAKRTMQAGINAAALGEQVWVAAGTYETSVGISDVELYGGFAGHEDPASFDLNLRDIAVNRTVFGGGQVASYTTPTRVDGLYIESGQFSSGQLFLGGWDLTIANCTIMQCDLALFCYFGAPRIINCTLSSNGTVFLCLEASPHIVNCTIAANTTVADLQYGIAPTFENSIVAQNGMVIRDYAPGPQPMFVGCCIYGNLRFASHESSAVDPSGSDGNFAADPRLANTAYGDFHLQPDSPCIDAAGPPSVPLPMIDADGQPRVQGLGLDVGADESDGIVRPTGPIRIVRVAIAGDDANDGLTWATAMRTIPAAITALGPAGGDVWVAEGTYGRVDIPSYVHLYGGFSGSEGHPDERDWTQHATILDGQNLRTVVQFTYGHRTGRLDGFTVQNGRNDGGLWGSGVDCWGAGPVISKNRILDCRSYALPGQSMPRGAISCFGTSPLIINNIVADNWNQGSGAGIHIANGSPVIMGNRIESNSAQENGGGIFVDSGSPWIIHNQFMGNEARSGSAIHCYSFFDSSGEPQIVGNTFVGHMNTAVTINTGYAAFVSGNTFCGNTRGLTSGTSNPIISNNVFAFNTEYSIFLNNTQSLRSNCVFPDVFGSALPSPTGTNGNISADPRFARNPSDGGDGWGDDPATPDIDEGANDDFGDLRLTNGSPCIDAGSNPDVPADWFDLDGDGDTAEPLPYDLRGRTRLFDDVNTPDTGVGISPIVDIGAYEFARGVPTAASASARPASVR